MSDDTNNSPHSPSQSPSHADSASASESGFHAASASRSKTPSPSASRSQSPSPGPEMNEEQRQSSPRRRHKARLNQGQAEPQPANEVCILRPSTRISNRRRSPGDPSQNTSFRGLRHRIVPLLPSSRKGAPSETRILADRSPPAIPLARVKLPARLPLGKKFKAKTTTTTLARV